MAHGIGQCQKGESVTKAERERIASFRHIGCIAAHLNGRFDSQYDVHHLTEGGRRLGHLFTIPLSPWAHRGIQDELMTTADMEQFYGPSLALNKRAFVARYGDERSLLAKVNALLDRFGAGRVE